MASFQTIANLSSRSLQAWLYTDNLFQCKCFAIFCVARLFVIVISVVITVLIHIHMYMAFRDQGLKWMYGYLFRSWPFDFNASPFILTVSLLLIVSWNSVCCKFLLNVSHLTADNGCRDTANVYSWCFLYQLLKICKYSICKFFLKHHEWEYWICASFQSFFQYVRVRFFI